MGINQPEQDPGEAIAPKKNTEIEDPLAVRQSETVPHIPPSPTNSPQSPAASQDNTPPWKKKLEIVAIVVAVGLLIVNIFQMWATQKAANATRDSVTLASDTAIRQLRAYVGLHQVGVMGITNREPFGVGFAFVNHGQTPASNVNMKGVVDLLPYPLPEDFALPETPDRARQDGVIFPNETNPMVGWVWERKNPPLTVNEKGRLFVKTTTEEAYAHGTVTYRDIFGVLRRTTFCYVLNPHSVVRNPAGDMIYDQKGNIQFQWAPVANRNSID
jgi:hypothetical protein